MQMICSFPRPTLLSYSLTVIKTTTTTTTSRNRYFLVLQVKKKVSILFLKEEVDLEVDFRIMTTLTSS